MRTTAEKIEYLNETKELIKQSLNDLGADIEDSNSFRSYVQKINTLYEDWPKITEEGTFLSLNSTQKGKMKIELKGNTLQDGTPTPDNPIDINVVSGNNVISTSNKNLLDISAITTQTLANVTITNNGDGSLTLNGTSNSTGALKDFLIKIPLKRNITYTFSKESFVSGSYYVLSLRDSSSTAIANSSLDSGVKYVNFTPQSDVLAKYLRLYIAPNKTFTNYTIRLMLEISSSTTPYEPHQGKELPLDLPVKNLLDISKVSLMINNAYLTTGTNRISVKPNTTYTFSVKYSNGQDGRISLYDNNDNNTNNYDQLFSPKNIRTFTTGENDSYLIIQRWYIGVQGITNVSEVEPQLEESSSVNRYTPYGVAPIELCKIGDYQDYFYKENENWYLHKEIGKVVLDGSETYETMGWSDDKNSYRTSINNLKLTTSTTDTSYILSNYFVTYTQAQLYELTVSNYGISNRANQTEVVIRNDNITSVLDFKTWLSTHNILLYYVLATATNTQITDTTLISQLDAIHNAMSYKEQTNILQENNNLPFILNVSALQKE